MVKEAKDPKCLTTNNPQRQRFWIYNLGLTWTSDHAVPMQNTYVASTRPIPFVLSNKKCGNTRCVSTKHGYTSTHTAVPARENTYETVRRRIQRCYTNSKQSTRAVLSVMYLYVVHRTYTILVYVTLYISVS